MVVVCSNGLAVLKDCNGRVQDVMLATTQTLTQSHSRTPAKKKEKFLTPKNLSCFCHSFERFQHALSEPLAGYWTLAGDTAIEDCLTPVAHAIIGLFGVGIGSTSHVYAVRSYLKPFVTDHTFYYLQDKKISQV